MKPVSPAILKGQFDKAMARAPDLRDDTRVFAVARRLGSAVGLAPREMEGVLQAVVGGSASTRAARMGISVNTLEGVVGLTLAKWSRLPGASGIERLQHLVDHIRSEAARR